MHEIAQTHVTRERLVAEALAARGYAYAPYSHYTVGAALLFADGTVIRGCNVENVSYGATICAERVALTTAVAQGRTAPVAIAVATRDGGSPCGVCRQVMAELGPDMIVLIGDEQGRFRETTVDALLPDRFSPASLTPPG
jgi:cytidine deaminase